MWDVDGWWRQSVMIMLESFVELLELLPFDSAVAVGVADLDEGLHLFRGDWQALLSERVVEEFVEFILGERARAVFIIFEEDIAEPIV